MTALMRLALIAQWAIATIVNNPDWLDQIAAEFAMLEKRT